jgi:tripartite-type tricarboxylate transporter receptor subunit TctC
VPPDRLAALRAAFAGMLKDPDFVAICEQRHFMVDAGTGEEMDAIVHDTFQLSDDIRAKIGAMLNAM